MSDIEHGSPRDLAAAYALGALSPDESREFETALATLPALERDVADYRDVAALLALAEPGAGAPSDLLRARVIAGGTSKGGSPRATSRPLLAIPCSERANVRWPPATRRSDRSSSRECSFSSSPGRATPTPASSSSGTGIATWPRCTPSG